MDTRAILLQREINRLKVLRNETPKLKDTDEALIEYGLVVRVFDKPDGMGGYSSSSVKITDNGLRWLAYHEEQERTATRTKTAMIISIFCAAFSGISAIAVIIGLFK